MYKISILSLFVLILFAFTSNHLEDRSNIGIKIIGTLEPNQAGKEIQLKQLRINDSVFTFYSNSTSAIDKNSKFEFVRHFPLQEIFDEKSDTNLVASPPNFFTPLKTFWGNILGNNISNEESKLITIDISGILIFQSQEFEFQVDSYSGSLDSIYNKEKKKYFLEREIPQLIK